MENSVFWERREGPTPNGGAYSVLYWRGKNGKRATREEAVGGEIVEFSKKGREIHRTYFVNQTDHGELH